MKIDDKLIGIHPGILLEKLLKDKSMSKRKLALSIGEHPQTISTITKGKRGMNVDLALKIEEFLKLKEGYLMIYQVYYDIKISKDRNTKPNMLLLRPILFWDTDIQKIDWHKQSKSIINRVFSRGNDIEKKEVERFYGKETILKYIDNASKMEYGKSKP